MRRSSPSPIPTLLRYLHRPLTRTRRPRPPAASRRYSYPKEGVFQPNSPPRNVPGFGPAPPLNPYEQQQGQWQQQPLQPPYEPSHQSIHVEPPHRRGPRRFVPRWYNVLGGLVLIATGAYQVHARLGFLFTLEPGSEEDREELELLFQELDTYALVRHLRAQKKHVEGEGEVAEWQEWTAYEGLDKVRRRGRLTTGPLAGSAGVAAQRVFWNDEMKQVFVFVNFGPGVTGWPDVVHGGAISTICDEALGRVAIGNTAERTAVTATLQVKFLDPVVPGQWYAVAASLDPEMERESTERKKYVLAVLMCVSEDSPSFDQLQDAHPHALANALYVVPKGAKPGPVPDRF